LDGLGELVVIISIDQLLYSFESFPGL
jgi:hypothetical protein